MDEVACCSHHSIQSANAVHSDSSSFLRVIEPSCYPDGQYQPLKTEWTFWYYEFKRGMEWDKCQHEISSCSTMEQFFTLFKNIKLASMINVTCDYAFFKNGIRPMWEDEINRLGGRWIIDIPKCYVMEELNILWTNLLMQLISENFYLAEYICGAVFSNRSKRNKIAIWIKQAPKHAIKSVGFQIRKNFNISDDIPIIFEFHSDRTIKTEQWKNGDNDDYNRY